MSNNVTRITDEMVEQFANDRQKEIIKYLRSSTPTQTGQHFNIAPSSVRSIVSRILKKAAKSGIAPYANLNHQTAAGFATKRISTFYDQYGNVSRQWHIQEPEKVKQLELLEEVTQAMVADVAPRKKQPIPTEYLEDDLMVNIPIGDAHIGMLAHASESGDDYNLQIAKDLHMKAIDMLIEASPNASQCTIIDLGDFLHSDNIEGRTSRSGHVLDMDGRYFTHIKAAIDISLYYIDQALTKFNQVTYRPEMGNHNDVGAIWIQNLLRVVYRDEPRVTIGDNAGVAFYWQHGDCYFMSHHGHQIKGNRLSELFAKQIMDNDIKSRHRKIYLGHVHHKSVIENSICEIETYRTLAAKDAYAASHGYHAGRTITAEVWHKKYGQIGMNQITVPMIEDAQ